MFQKHCKSKNYKCTMCDLKFCEQRIAEEHINVHTGQTPFQCSLCSKKYPFTWLYTIHQQTVHGYNNDKLKVPIKLECKLCDKTFNSDSARRKHNARTHNRSKVPILCDICGKSLASTETLKFHKRTHTGYKPHTCFTCGKSFFKKNLIGGT